MGKPLQQDENGNIMNDTVTKETQKGYSNYESENAKKQATRDAEDQKTKDKWMSIMKSGMDMLGSPIKKAKGGTASARADGCAVKGKTKGTIIACTGGYMKGKK
jgi:hypothetical protein